MLCTRCKKRQAVVFVQRLENGKPVQEGYCLTCARELHIQPVDDLMKRFNMTDDQLASMEEHMADLMQQAQESGAMMPMMDGDMQNPDDTGDDFVPGGSPVGGPFLGVMRVRPHDKGTAGHPDHTQGGIVGVFRRNGHGAAVPWPLALHPNGVGGPGPGCGR